MRVLLFTGKGGVGKTTVAAATAVHAARLGRKVLVLSTDPAHSLADALAFPLGPDPTEVEDGLQALQVEPRAALERGWAEVQSWLRGVLAGAGVDALQAEELTVLPGAEEVLALLELRAHAAAGRHDLLVVDCAPTGETLRLLALPEALATYLERVLPAHRRALRAVRPLLPRSTPAPPDRVVAAAVRLAGQLADVRALLTAPTTSVRLVCTPESVVVAETRRTRTALALYGYHVDGVVANRVLPASTDPFVQRWSAAQAEQLAVLRRDLGVVDEQPLLPAEPVGLTALAAAGQALYGDRDPLAAGPAEPEPLDVRADGPDFTLSLALPLARRQDVGLARSGDELVLTVAGHRRLLLLPSVLRRCSVQGAALHDGTLHVRFVRDPALWPQ